MDDVGGDGDEADMATAEPLRSTAQQQLHQHRQLDHQHHHHDHHYRLRDHQPKKMRQAKQSNKKGNKMFFDKGRTRVRLGMMDRDGDAGVHAVDERRFSYG